MLFPLGDNKEFCASVACDKTFSLLAGSLCAAAELFCAGAWVAAIVGLLFFSVICFNDYSRLSFKIWASKYSFGMNFYKFFKFYIIPTIS